MSDLVRERAVAALQEEILRAGQETERRRGTLCGVLGSGAGVLLPVGYLLLVRAGVLPGQPNAAGHVVLAVATAIFGSVGAILAGALPGAAAYRRRRAAELRERLAPLSREEQRAVLAPLEGVEHEDTRDLVQPLLREVTEGPVRTAILNDADGMLLNLALTFITPFGWLACNFAILAEWSKNGRLPVFPLALGGLLALGLAVAAAHRGRLRRRLLRNMAALPQAEQADLARRMQESDALATRDLFRSLGRRLGVFPSELLPAASPGRGSEGTPTEGETSPATQRAEGRLPNG